MKKVLLQIGLAAGLLCLVLPRPAQALTREEVRQRSLKRLEQVSESVMTGPQAENPSGVSLGRPFPTAGDVSDTTVVPAPRPSPAHPTDGSDRAAERRTDEAVIIPTDHPTSPAATSPGQIAPVAQPAQPVAPGNAARRADVAPADRRKATELFRQALAAARKGSHKKALSLLNKAAALDPTDPDILNNRGNVHNNLGDLQKALADYDAAISLGPADAAAHANRGLAHERSGDDAAACRDYRAACDLGDCEFYESFRKEGRCPR